MLFVIWLCKLVRMRFDTWNFADEMYKTDN